MAATLFHEHIRMQQIERRTMEIRQMRLDIFTIQHQIIVLASLGENVMVWHEDDYRFYQTHRLRVDSMLQKLQENYKDIVGMMQVNTLHQLLADKEEHLFQIMQVFHQQRKADSLLINHLPEVSRQAIQTRTVIQKKKGITKLFGSKRTVKLPPSPSKLHSLNQQLITMQTERMHGVSSYMDSLRIRNKEVNCKLHDLITDIDNHIQTTLQEREQHITDSYRRSTSIITILIAIAIILLVISNLIIQRDFRQKTRDKKKMEQLIDLLRKSGQKNEKLITSRKKAMHTIIHELRTPLAAISGYIGLIDKKYDVDKIGIYIQNIQQSSDRMRDMLNTLLDFFRLDNGKEQPRLSPCRISSIVHTLETEFMPVAMNKGLYLTIKTRSDAIVLTDKERIIQIGNNLLSNAIKFTENGGVSLAADYTNDILTFVVEDTGTGMIEEEQQRVFGAFERLSNAAAKDGFGLGLAIVHNIVTMLHGTIRLESEKGRGSRFTVEIPAQKAGELPKQAIQTYIHRKDRNLNVVAIDNDEVLLLMLKEMYAQEGIQCDTCMDVAELMEMIRRKAYSMLLTDLNMPGINGFELLELLRSSNVGNSRNIPVVVTTAAGSCSKKELMERGFTGYLYKPFSMSELIEVSKKYAIKGTSDKKPDFSALLSYGNESVMVEKLITETEKEMQAIRDAVMRNDLQKLDALTHHLRSSWEILCADQPLRELYRLLHSEEKPNNYTLSLAVNTVLDMGAEIIRLAKEERRKHEDG